MRTDCKCRQRPLGTCELISQNRSHQMERPRNKHRRVLVPCQMAKWQTSLVNRRLVFFELVLAGTIWCTYGVETKPHCTRVLKISYLCACCPQLRGMADVICKKEQTCHRQFKAGLNPRNESTYNPAKMKQVQQAKIIPCSPSDSTQAQRRKSGESS